MKQTAAVGKVVKAHDPYFLTEDKALYTLDGWGETPLKIADHVTDFKVVYEQSQYIALYRTTDYNLYAYYYENSENKFLMPNCSEWYTFTFAKANDGKWWHAGANENHSLEPAKLMDGYDIIPEYFDTMVEASQYVYKSFQGENVYEWALDGNLYHYKQNGDGEKISETTLIASNIMYMNYNSAVTADGDIAVFEHNKKPCSMDYNIKDLDAYIEAGNWYSGVYIDRDEGISYAVYPKVKRIGLGDKYINRSDWADAEIALADEIGFINSVKFLDMQSNIRREDFCNIIVDFCEKYLGRELSTTSNPFRDTENEKVVKAYANGIIAGVSGNRFAPDDKITREQMCAIMTRAAKLLKSDIQFGEGVQFSDMADVSDWAVEGVNAMSGLGIVRGDGVSIAPQSNTSIEQAIAMTYRLYNKIK